MCALWFLFPGFLSCRLTFNFIMSNLLLNLSLSTNLPKTNVQSEDVMRAVNKTLEKYYYESHYRDYEANYYNTHQTIFGTMKCLAAMQSEKIILCEINADLWLKAIHSGINCITVQSYPHYIIVERFINYLLNATSNENFGQIEEFFSKLLTSYPPKVEMYDYYLDILSAQFVRLCENKTEDQSLFFCLTETISNILKTYSTPSSRKSLAESKPTEEVAVEFNKTALKCKKPEVKEKQKQMYFVNLHWREKLRRCFLVLRFVYNILETNFIFWLHSNNLKPSSDINRPLISCLLWSDVRDIGIMNKEVHKTLDLYKLALESKELDFSDVQIIEKLVTLTGEIVRNSDGVEEGKYPFLGTKCSNFVRELSTIFYQRFAEDRVTPKENELIFNFKPSWLRLLLSSQLLTSITGDQCLPELTAVYDILEHIVHTESKGKETMALIEKTSESVSPNVVPKLKKLKSINAKLNNGKTRLHSACEDNDIQKIKALLAFPELDVNAVDRNGWTALHTAAQKGNVNSVQELLSFSPESFRKSVNTRARGPESFTPLMCAVSQGHAKVSEILLQHSGSVLLEDVNELNQTALELSNVKEVTEILEYYKKNQVWTFHSHKNINFDSDLKGIVLRLCIELIQAYFCTHRTWDVYKTLKRSGENLGEHIKTAGPKWDYMCYHRDIKRNIYKLRKLIPKLCRIEEFKELHEVFVRLLSFNKIC